MKKIVFILLLIPLFAYSKTSLDILEKAYIKFEQKKYKSSSKLFLKYYDEHKGTKEDYYFTAITLSQTGEIELAVEYADLAATDISSYAMMLNDELLAPIHKKIAQKHDALVQFYALFNNGLILNTPNGLYKIDSMYRQLPVKKLSNVDLTDIAHSFMMEDDTTLALFYIRETFNRGKIFAGIEKRIYSAILHKFESRYPDKFYESFDFLKQTEQKEQVIEEELDDLEKEIKKLHEKNKIQALLKTTPFSPEGLYNLAIKSINSHEYEKAASFLIQCTNNEFNMYDSLFTNKTLLEFYHSKEGLSFLRYLVSEKYVPAMIKSDMEFHYTDKNNNRKKNILFEYLEAKEFNSSIPFQFFKLRSANFENSLIVPISVMDANVPHSFSHVLQLQGRKKIAVSEPDSNTSAYIALVRKTQNKLFADKSGLYYTYPAENTEFVRQVKSGKFKQNRIPEIRSRHIGSLTKHKLYAAMKAGIEEDEETAFVALDCKLNLIDHSLNELFMELPKEDIAPVIQFCKYISSINTDIIEYSIKILNDTSYYKSLDAEKKIRFRGVVSEIEEVFPKDIFETMPDLNSLNEISSDEAFVVKMNEIGKEYEKRWEEYKSTKSE